MMPDKEMQDSNLLLKTNFDIISIFLSYTDWYDALGKIFSMVASRIDVDRIYYFQIHSDEISGDELTSQRFEWVKTGIEPMIDNPELQNLPIGQVADFMGPLKKGHPFNKVVRDLPEGNTRSILDSQGILSILVLPIDVDGKLYGFIGFDDCTRERSWSDQEFNFLQSLTSNLASAIARRNALLDSEAKALELRKINEELEQFAYVASHDLQEPLRMITSFLGLFEKKFSDLVDEEGRTYIHYAVNGASNLKRIIDDLLEFSRVGRTANSLEEVKLSELFSQIAGLFEKKIIEKGASFSLTRSVSLVTWRAPLRQILINLLDNSLKYAREGVRPEIILDVQEQANQWYFTFSDNGIGIDPLYFKKIFLIFQRLHTRDQYEGKGLGLAIVKKILDNIGGKIWVSSVPGENATFHFTIPKGKFK